MGDIAFDGFGWANNELEPYMSLREIIKDYNEYGYPDYLTPFREENGDYYCFDTSSQSEGEFPVVIFDHNANDIERDANYQWSNFTEWLYSTLQL